MTALAVMAVESGLWLKLCPSCVHQLCTRILHDFHDLLLIGSSFVEASVMTHIGGSRVDLKKNVDNGLRPVTSEQTQGVIMNKLHCKKRSVGGRSTTYRPLTDHLPTTYQLTTYQPPTNHLPTTYWPLTDHLLTTYRPLTDHLPTTCTYRPLFYGAACSRLPTQGGVCAQFPWYLDSW